MVLKDRGAVRHGSPSSDEWREPDIDRAAVEYRLLAVSASECGFSETADALFRKAVTAQAGGDIGVQTLYAERTHAMARTGPDGSQRDARSSSD